VTGSPDVAGTGAVGGGFAASETQPPDVTPADAARLADAVFGVSGTACDIGSQQDRNFRIDTATGRYVLKVANPAVGAVELACQNAAIEHLAGGGMVVPRALPARSGADLERVAVDGRELAIRLLEFVEGVPLAQSGYLAPAVRGALGGIAATACDVLSDFHHPGLDRHLEWDLRHASAVVSAYAPHIPRPADREPLLAAAAAAAKHVARVAQQLRIQPIHGDVTDDNVVCRIGEDGRAWPFALIDFGDVGRSWLVGELAITCASLLHHAPDDPLAWLPAVAGFHAVVPLRRAEAEALWPLVVLRGATLVVTDEKQLSIDPGNDYVAENRHHDWRIFESAVALPAELATAAIEEAIGLADDAAPLAGAGFSVLLPGLPGPALTTVDLSPPSELLDEGRWLEPGIEDLLFAEADAPALARYGEYRITRSALDRPDELPTSALHAELQVAAGTTVASPAAGHVAEAGPARIVLACGRIWVHLDGAEATLGAGAQFAAGDVVGVVSARPSAGWGRLCVQICRVPGLDPPHFARPSTAAAWRRLCPDPSPLLGIDCAVPAVDPQRLLERRAAVFAGVQEHYYASPPQIERGWRHHLTDANARTYLDMVNNVTVVGHGHPRVARELARQARLLNTNSRFAYAALVEFCERLVQLAPDGLDSVFLVNSGTEANDLALRMAWAHTGRQVVVTMREGYHGWSAATDAVSTSVADNPAAVATRPAWVRLLPVPGSVAAEGDIEEAVAAIRRLGEAGDPPAALICEPVRGNAGGAVLPSGYLGAVYAAVRAGGGVCIADEVQVAYGRLGRWFWGFEQQAAVPDVITIAKAAGNGHPLGAVITRRELAESYAGQGPFFSSTGGNPVSCRVGLAVLDVLAEERLQENAQATGAHLLGRLHELATRHPMIGAVHGVGLYAGVELVRAGRPGEPAAAEAQAICERLLERSVIVQPTGDHLNVLKIKPPLCITAQSADFFVDQLDAVLAAGW
jgi:4-aminobutyrate aminotransferase-like enzyme/Ser/Thr protein kinase RdoA (MazF antagonist)